MLIYSWISMAIVIAAALVVGRAAMRLAGSRRWSGLEPAVGLAAIMTVEGFLARVPANRQGLVLGFALLVLVSLWILRDARRPDLPTLSVGLLITLAVAFLAVNLPFLISGRWGLLGLGYNNDLGLHLAWADWLRSGVGTEPGSGYPLGPHGLAAALSFIPRLNLAAVFTGQLMAIVLLTAWTAWEAVRRLAGWKRPLAAVLVAIPYLIASYYAQAAFKELLTALFLLAFVIGLERIRSGEIEAGGSYRLRSRLLPPAILAAGIVFTYSFPGLVWPVAVLIAIALVDSRVRAKLRPAPIWRMLRHPWVAAGGLILIGLLLALVFAGKFGFGSDFAEVAKSDAFGPVSPVEGLGVWLDPDYRLDGMSSPPLPGLLGAIAGLALLVSLWWWRREESPVWPAAFLGCAFVYLVSLPWMGDYSLAKALAVSAPVTMTVILIALLSGPAGGWKPAQGMEFGGWVSLAALFVAGAAASSFVVLRDASVSPPGHAGELIRFSGKLAGRSVLFMDQDRFAQWYLSGAKVGIPLAEFPDPRVIENPKKPFQGDHGQATIDFDSFEPETFANFEYAISTAAGWQSMTPPFYREVDRTPNYVLWRRIGPPFGRPIMREGAMPAKLVDCQGEAGSFFRTISGEAVLMPETVVVDGVQWMPTAHPGQGEGAAATTFLKPGTWRISLQYFSPNGMRLTAAGYDRKFPASLDGQRLANRDTGSNGPYWPGGLIRVKRAGPVTFTVTTTPPTFLQRLTGYGRKTDLGRLVLTRPTSRSRVPMNRICNRWVDFYRWKQDPVTGAGQESPPTQSGEKPAESPATGPS